MLQNEPLGTANMVRVVDADAVNFKYLFSLASIFGLKYQFHFSTKENSLNG